MARKRRPKESESWVGRQKDSSCSLSSPLEGLDRTQGKGIRPRSSRLIQIHFLLLCNSGGHVWMQRTLLKMTDDCGVGDVHRRNSQP